MRNAAGLGRRELLRMLSGIPAVGRIVPLATSPGFAQDRRRFLAAVGKDPRLILHDAVTGVAETPLRLLREHRVTPKELLFVRNNQVLQESLTLSPYPSDGWSFEVSGLVRPARTISFPELARLKQTEVVAVLQCAGNGRAFYSRTAPTKGTQWQHGGMGQVRWKGVRLKQLLDSFRIFVDPRAQFLTAEGRDSPASPGGDDYEQSVPVADVLNSALLATHMNGEPIPAIHGGPVRLVLPGYYGSMNVKWLSRLRFGDEASTSRHHAERYRTFRERIEPGAAPQVTAESTVPTWRQKIKTVVWTPLDGERHFPGPITFSGVAWNDGRTDIVAVELSLDGGDTWRRVPVDDPLSQFGWYPWRATFWNRWNQHVRPDGTVREVRVRAFDAFGRSQPDDGSVHWNPSGYEWFGVDGVSVLMF